MEPAGPESADPAASDPFGTAARRRLVLDAWTASPARFREDANAEEDLVLGGYRDRLVVELAQNAADAAARAGIAGRLLFSLRTGPAGGGELTVANTGTPLDAAGVESLSTLRASAKRSGATVGRFGVGFASVLALSDEPAVLSGELAGVGVGWSAAATRELVAGAPSLAVEARRRHGSV
ncbi:MAG: molecular chaperone Hsp90, partial [Actinomycetota bacterium]|nr:molecular chaperone Hsp90 [Actinomycetota bacterium]